MIVYSENKRNFQRDVVNGNIKDKILTAYKGTAGGSVSKSEQRSWQNSLMYMNNVMASDGIPAEAGVAIEYKIPRTNKRIDFLISGKNEGKQKVAIIIELKQWETADRTEMDGIVTTYINGGIHEKEHPSYQAWTYAALLEDFSEAVEKENIGLWPCAFLHNLMPKNAYGVMDRHYSPYLEKAPIFLGTDTEKLQAFISRHVKYGDGGQALYEIDNGKIRPSKNLADYLSSMLKGNEEFLMIDEQKLVYETALRLSKEANVVNRQVLIVEGGPGTGKSVVAMNLLTTFTSQGKVAQYVTKNSAPRIVYESMLTGSQTASRIRNLFKGSGAYTTAEKDSIDVLLVDEAHRLNEKSGLYGNLGENQIKELMSAAPCTVFFIDENQRVTLKDIGEKDEIRKWAKEMGASVAELELPSQFRCNGSDGYLSWLDNTLGIRETANESLQGTNYDFRVFDSASELRDEILSKNLVNNKARLVAGYCWNWVSKRNPSLDDITLPDGFSAKWNLAQDGSLWILKPESVQEVGCIHTCQGLEVDYIGVILGADLIVRNGHVVTQAEERARTDQSLRGYKTLSKSEPVEAKFLADMIIKNTYRTLMTRGSRGCYIYSVDEETNQYFKKLVNPRR